jgi:hypothetical protein
MILSKASTLVLMGALTLGAAGCANNDYDNANTAATPSAREVEKEDGSMVSTTKATDGTVTEVRTFETGEVARVTRRTPPEGEPTATVEFRDGRNVELEDESDIENAMEASGDAIAKAAAKAWDATKDIGKEVGDKAEDVADKAVDVGKDIGSKVGEGVKKAGKKIKGDGK